MHALWLTKRACACAIEHMHALWLTKRACTQAATARGQQDWVDPMESRPPWNFDIDVHAEYVSSVTMHIPYIPRSLDPLIPRCPTRALCGPYACPIRGLGYTCQVHLAGHYAHMHMHMHRYTSSVITLRKRVDISDQGALRTYFRDLHPRKAPTPRASVVQAGAHCVRSERPQRPQPLRAGDRDPSPGSWQRHASGVHRGRSEPALEPGRGLRAHLRESQPRKALTPTYFTRSLSAQHLRPVSARPLLDYVRASHKHVFSHSTGPMHAPDMPHACPMYAPCMP